MSKIKIINKTGNTFFSKGYAFPPGEVVTQELDPTTIKKFNAWIKTPTMSARVKDGTIIFEIIKDEPPTTPVLPKEPKPSKGTDSNKDGE